MKDFETRTTVIPALPGFDVVELWGNGREEDPYQFHYEPVVAWIVHVYHYEEKGGHAAGSHSSPVTTDQIFYENDQAIRQSNGSIVFPVSRRFEKGEEAAALQYAIKCRKDQDEEYRKAAHKAAARILTTGG